MQNGGKDLHPRSGQRPVHPGSDTQLPVPAHLLSADEVIRGLNVDPDNGLTEEEARVRVQIAGPNELAGGGGVSPLRILAGQVFNAMVLVSSGFPEIGIDIKVRVLIGVARS